MDTLVQGRYGISFISDHSQQKKYNMQIKYYVEVEAEGKKKKGHQIGTAVVGSGANGKKSKCPSGNVGKSATGQANGCEHADCTAAKNAARATLRGQVPSECHKYIQANSPCQKVGC